jgi:hypothetical protein
MTSLRTVGHGTLSAEAFAVLLDTALVRRVVDVRSFPGSRQNPHFRRGEMEQWVPMAGIDYVWIRELGGRRRALADSKHLALRNKAFRAYADYMETHEFLAGVEDLLALATSELTAVMCSESVWWRCHRRLLADHLALVRRIEVVHLMHDGRLTPHVPTQGVRVAGDTLVYDVGTKASLPVDESSAPSKLCLPGVSDPETKHYVGELVGDDEVETPGRGAVAERGIELPPSTGSTTPVMNRASSEAKKSAACATSQPLP